jgi:hypothetical protein
MLSSVTSFSDFAVCVLLILYDDGHNKYVNFMLFLS